MGGRYGSVVAGLTMHVSWEVACCIVVEHKMQLEFSGSSLFSAAENPQFLVPIAPVAKSALGNHST